MERKSLGAALGAATFSTSTHAAALIVAAGGIGFTDWASTILLSVFGGLVSLLQMLALATPPRWPVFIAAHLSSSIAAGVLVLLLGQAHAIDVGYVGIAIFLCSYAGARFLNAASNWLVARIAPAKGP